MKKNMSNKGKSLMIGVTTLATVMMFYFGFNFLKGVHIFDKSDLYYMSFDNLQGIDLSSKVTLNGYKVGNVRAIDFDYSGKKGATLTVALNNNLEIPKGAYAAISANPLGGSVVVLSIPKELSGDILQNYDTIPGVPSEDVIHKLSAQLLPSLNRATLSLDTLIHNLNALATDPAIRETFGEVKESAIAIKSSSQKIDRMLSSEMPIILDNIDASTRSIAEMTGKMNKAELEQMLTNLTDTMADLKSFMAKLNDDKGSLGQLLNDQALYDRLVKTTQAADSLLVDIQANPKKYVHFSLF